MRREVQLKAGFGERYPALMPGRWYTAAAVASLMKVPPAGYPDLQDKARLLDPEHFQFRGGSARSGAWAGLRTRQQDRHVDLSTF
jgi:hypothetical protein